MESTPIASESANMHWLPTRIAKPACTNTKPKNEKNATFCCERKGWCLERVVRARATTDDEKTCARLGKAITYLPIRIHLLVGLHPHCHQRNVFLDFPAVGSLLEGARSLARHFHCVFRQRFIHFCSKKGESLTLTCQWLFHLLSAHSELNMLPIWCAFSQTTTGAIDEAKIRERIFD